MTKSWMRGNRQVMMGNRRVMMGNRRVMRGNNLVMMGNRQVMRGNNLVMMGNRRVMRGNNLVMATNVYDARASVDHASEPTESYNLFVSCVASWLQPEVKDWGTIKGPSGLGSCVRHACPLNLFFRGAGNRHAVRKVVTCMCSLVVRALTS
jgi:hypothetical protein